MWETLCKITFVNHMYYENHKNAVHPCESKIAPALNFDAYFLRLILLFFSFLHIKLMVGF